MVGATVPPMWSPDLMSMFDDARSYLDMKRDKDEEVMRISKDITWESKKIIYALHNFISKDKALQDSQRRLQILLTSEKHFKGLATALRGEDLYQHHRRFTHCTQEYVEAYAFHKFLDKRTIPTYEEVQNSLVIKLNTNENEVIQIPVTETDYMLGILDFTGELMKATVPTFSRPQWHALLVQSFAFVRQFYAGLLSVSSGGKIFYSKLRTLRQSVQKIETTVYKLKMKILVTGRLPDSQEVAHLQRTVTGASDRRLEDKHDDGEGDLDYIIDSVDE